MRLRIYHTLMAHKIGAWILLAGMLTLSAGCGAATTANGQRAPRIVPTSTAAPATSPAPTQQQPDAKAAEVVQPPVRPVAKLNGYVRSANGTAIERARVQVLMPDGVEEAATLSGNDGSWEIEGLSAGSFLVVATKTGYVPRAFGQRRVGQAGALVELGDGQQLTLDDFTLVPGGAIAGNVYDENGELLANATVEVLRPVHQDGQRLLVMLGRDQSDDRGEYRVFALPAGSYYVTVYDPAFTKMDDDGMNVRYAPTFYPGVTNVVDARRVTLGRAGEINDINIRLRLVRAARVSGKIVTQNGLQLLSGAVIMTPATAGEHGFSTSAGALIAPDNSFAFDNVPPGRYVIRARGDTGIGVSSFATFVLAVDGNDVSNINMILSPGAVIAGNVIFDSGATPPPKDMSKMFVEAPLHDGTRWGGETKSGVASNGSFQLNGVLSGARYIRIQQLPPPWWLKSVIVQGRDAMDIPIDVQGGQQITEVRLVLSDRPSQLSGIVRDNKARPVLSYVVVAFPLQPTLWRPGSRHIKTARPDAGSRYLIHGLPDGDYLVVALSDIDESEVFDAETLAHLAPKAVRFSIKEGEKLVIDLKLTDVLTDLAF